MFGNISVVGNGYTGNIGLNGLLAKVALFAELDMEQLLGILDECEIKEFEVGKYVCREGEYDENCYIILAGIVEVRVGSGSGAGHSNVIPLKEGEMFGEIAVLTGNPRIADIVASQHATLLKISKNVLFMLIDKFQPLKQRLDDLYRQRALTTQLLTIPIFSGISAEILEELKGKVVLQTFRKDEVIFRQDDMSDAFYLVRYGFVKVYKEDKGKERVLAYLNEGHYFGEMGLMAEGEKRIASVAAINRVELIKISKEDFDALLDAHPGIRKTLQTITEHRKSNNAQFSKDINRSAILSSTIEMGIIQSKAILIIDLTKCVHCDMCTKACATLHDGQTRLARRGTLLSNFLLVPTSCRHCIDPTCMSKCPTGAIARDFEGEIYHKDSCIGCGGCAANCPHGNISIVAIHHKKAGDGLYAKMMSLFSAKEDGAMSQTHDGQGTRHTAAKKQKSVRKKAVKCDMCRGMEHMGCVYNCPRNAARRVDPTKFFADFTSIG